jgi:hypothetical protein
VRLGGAPRIEGYGAVAHLLFASPLLELLGIPRPEFLEANLAVAVRVHLGKSACRSTVITIHRPAPSFRANPSVQAFGETQFARKRSIAVQHARAQCQRRLRAAVVLTIQFRLRERPCKQESHSTAQHSTARLPMKLNLPPNGSARLRHRVLRQAVLFCRARPAMDQPLSPVLARLLRVCSLALAPHSLARSAGGLPVRLIPSSFDSLPTSTLSSAPEPSASAFTQASPVSNH